jgi:hypothetical protein
LERENADVFDKSAASRSPSRVFHPSREGAGWEVKVEEDRTPTRRAFYRDWHRVELALALFQREVAELVGDGWEVIHHSTESVGV